MAEPTAPRRAAFARTVLAGLVTSALAAVASGKAWYVAAVDLKLTPGIPESDRSADMPLAVALSLVVLAAWGALLVGRGRVRRVVASIAILAALGVIACVVVAPFTLPDQVREQLPVATAATSVSPTGWYVTAAVASVLALLVLAVAWRGVPGWPTMSSRYDAPTARTTVDPATAAPLDLWKALDEGHDPTDPTDPADPASP